MRIPKETFTNYHFSGERSCLKYIVDKHGTDGHHMITRGHLDPVAKVS